MLFEMCIRYPMSILQLLSSILIISSHGPIIKLEANYDRRSPWKELVGLGLENLTETECQRECIADELPRVCLYTFVLENYMTMGPACGKCSKGVLEDCFLPQCIPADGYERTILPINRMIPGPTINVCKNDLVMVNVKNMMQGRSASIHWHGILHEDSPWMDGVPYVTQCPITSGTFRYVFPASNVGTMYYHSHEGLHKGDGHFGAFIVREPRSLEPWTHSVYDLDLPEHVIIINDWMHYLAEMRYPGLTSEDLWAGTASFLVNGLGRHKPPDDSNNVFIGTTPLATFHVERNKRYRFRIIYSGGLVCPIQIQIQGHNMTVIATDGYPVFPTEVDALILSTGERFDVVIDTGRTESSSRAFWIHIRGLGKCQSVDDGLDQLAVLSYGTKKNDLGTSVDLFFSIGTGNSIRCDVFLRDLCYFLCKYRASPEDLSELRFNRGRIVPFGYPPTHEDPLPVDTRLNHPMARCGHSSRDLCVTELRLIASDKDREILTAKPDIELTFMVGFQIFKAETFHREGIYEPFMITSGTIKSGTMNGISFQSPSRPMLLDRDSDFGFCNTHANNSTSTVYQRCTYVITVKPNTIVQMVLMVDVAEERGIYHPYHLHGNAFYVMRVGHCSNKFQRPGNDDNRCQLPEEKEPVWNNGEQYLPPLKDTQSIPESGFVVLRWKADNPGDWLFHCHLDTHMASGMGMIFRVEGDITEEPPGLPTCDNFDPLVAYRANP